MLRYPMAIALAFATLAPHGQAQGSLVLRIDGWSFGSPSVGPEASATASLTSYAQLELTRQGRIEITAAAGSWTLLATDVAIEDPSTSSEYQVWSELIVQYPWLLRSESTVQEELPAYIDGLVDPADLVNNTTPLLVPGPMFQLLVGACINPANYDPSAVRSWAQPVLSNVAGPANQTWRSLYPTWLGTPMEQFWMNAYAQPRQAGETFEQIDWLRLMESSARVESQGLPINQQWREFARSGDLSRAAGLGLHLHIQAISMRGSVSAPPTNDPATTPGLIITPPQGGPPAGPPRFTVSPPITIAIPYTPPVDEGATVPYYPDLLDPTVQPGGIMIAAIGFITSATHAVFPGPLKYQGDEEGEYVQTWIQVPLIRAPGPEGNLAWFQVPGDAQTGYVEFVDLLGPDESALLPINGFFWTRNQ